MYKETGIQVPVSFRDVYIKYFYRRAVKNKLKPF